MNRPYIVCHMVTSIDGKVTGDFLGLPACEDATEVYYEINREYKSRGSGGFICGRITMEGSFTGGAYPDLSEYEPPKKENGRYSDFWSDVQNDYYAIAFDPRGKLGWKSAFIEDFDPGYDKAQIIEVLTEQVDGRYLSYLRDRGISYFFAGDVEIDVEYALNVISNKLRPKFYLLEGGSIINGHFLRAGCIDELSLVQAPVTADKDSKALFADGVPLDFELTRAVCKKGATVLNYKVKKQI